MDYLEAIAKYTTPDGVVTLTDPPAKTDNNFLFTATDIYVRKRLGLDPAPAINKFFEYKVARSNGAICVLPEPEKSWGHPNISHDEINAIACVLPHDPCLKPFCWSYNTTGDFKDHFLGWYWRMGYLVPFIRAASGRKVPWLEQVWYAKDIMHAIDGQHVEPGIESSTRCLFVLQSQHREKFPKRMRDALEHFLFMTERQFGDLGGLYSVYFGKSHPFAIYTQGVKLL